jgi:uncharacterized membrane protein
VDLLCEYIVLLLFFRCGAGSTKPKLKAKTQENKDTVQNGLGPS